MKIKVLLLTQWFDPEPTFKGLVFAKALQEQGFDVEVLTGFPNYPGGKVYPGYRVRWIQREIMDGVHVTRVPLYPSHDQSALKRAFNYVSFLMSSLIYGLFFARRFDVIYAYHPPLSVGITASLLKVFRRKPLVFDVQDMWPDTLRATGMLGNERLLRFIGKVCDWVYRRSDAVVVLSPGFKNLLIERGVPAEKIEIIYNWADEKSLQAPAGVLPNDFPDATRFKILFAGNMGKAQALDTILESAAILKANQSPATFILVGGGVETERLKLKSKELTLDNVQFIAPMPMNQVGTVLQAADVLLVHLRKDPLFKITIPSKTQAYMAAGKPILMGVDGDAAQLIVQSQCGWVVPSENAQALAEEVDKLINLTPNELKAKGDQAKSFYERELSVMVGVKRFADIFRRLTRG
jgi:colanic acid biosynthesis glycosyl transferase WcaI